MSVSFPVLADLLKASASARIVNVSSCMHCKGTVNVKFLTGEEWPGSCSQAYNSSKLMNVVFTIELARQLQGTGERLGAQRKVPAAVPVGAAVLGPRVSRVSSRAASVPRG